MENKVSTEIYAPIDLVWEFVSESTFEEDACPISGLQGGKILEEYEDGLLREVLFNGRKLKQRVSIKDETYTFHSEFEGEDEGGEVTNQLEDMGDHLTRMEIVCSWHAPDLNEAYKVEMQSLFEDRLKTFKQSTEDLWAEKGTASASQSASTMH